MTAVNGNGGRSILDQFTATYLRARWYIGAGLVVVPLIVFAIGAGRAFGWVASVAGLFILAHALATVSWHIDDPFPALIVDLSAAFTSVLIFANANRDATAAMLLVIGGSMLITLFTYGWRRVVLLGLAFGFTVATLLAAWEWDLPSITGQLIGVVFGTSVVVGVISAVRARLSELEAARAQTMGVVSHELRNHLAGVIGATELVAKEWDDLEPEVTRELVDLASRQASEAGEVIEDLLTVSRAERGVLEVSPVPTELCSLTETGLKRFFLDEREMDLDCSGEPTWALVDPLRYGQILRNLLTNAVRYGGSDIRVSLVTVGEVVSLVVADDGEGVDPSDARAIFEPYRRGHNQAGAPGSTGLGLWIARTMARRMGGDLTYLRQSGQTLFELTVPRCDPPRARHEASPASAQAG